MHFIYFIYSFLALQSSTLVQCKCNYTQLTSNRGVQVFSSSRYASHYGSPKYAVDGNTSTYMQTGCSVERRYEWLIVKLPTAHVINHVTIQPINFDQNSTEVLTAKMIRNNLSEVGVSIKWSMFKICGRTEYRNTTLMTVTCDKKIAKYIALRRKSEHPCFLKLSEVEIYGFKVGNCNGQPVVKKINFNTSIFYEGSSVKVFCSVRKTPCQCQKPKVKLFLWDTTHGIEQHAWVEQEGKESPFIVELTAKSTKYKCVAINKNGNHSKQKTIDVKYGPKLSRFKLNRNVSKLGSEVVIFCEYTEGNPSGSGKIIKLDKNSEQNFNLQTNTTTQENKKVLKLKIKSLTLKHGGSYKCLVGNNVNNQSETLNLTVFYPPKLGICRSDPSYPKLNSYVTISCEIQEFGYPRFTEIIIYKNVNMPLHGRLKGNKYITQIYKLRKEDAGSYSIALRSQHFPSQDRNLSVAVSYLPKIHTITIINSTKRSYITEGENLTFTCLFDHGYPHSRVEWFFKPKNDRKFKKLKAGISESNKMTTLNLKKIERLQSGTYKCQAVNNIGSIYKTASINISYISVRPEEKLIRPAEGKHFSLDFEITAYPKQYSISWKKDGENFTCNKVAYCEIRYGTGSYKMSFRKAEKQHSGEYECEIIHQSRKIIQLFTVIVEKQKSADLVLICGSVAGALAVVSPLVVALVMICIYRREKPASRFYEEHIEMDDDFLLEPLPPIQGYANEDIYGFDEETGEKTTKPAITMYDMAREASSAAIEAGLNPRVVYEELNFENPETEEVHDNIPGDTEYGEFVPNVPVEHVYENIGSGRAELE